MNSELLLNPQLNFDHKLRVHVLRIIIVLSFLLATSLTTKILSNC